MLPTESSTPRTLIITRSRAAWHARLTSPDEVGGADAFWSDKGGEPGVRERMRRVDVRYCPTPAHALLLLATLHVRSSPISGDVDHKDGLSTSDGGGPTPDVLEERPGCVIAYDLLGLWEDAELRDEVVSRAGTGDGGEDAPQGAASPGHPRWKPGMVADDYLSLMAMLRECCLQLGGEGQTPELIVVEPSLNSAISTPIARASDMRSSQTRSGGRGRPESAVGRVRLVRALETVLGGEMREGVDVTPPPPLDDADDPLARPVATRRNIALRDARARSQDREVARCEAVQREGRDWEAPGWSWAWSAMQEGVQGVEENGS